MSYKSTLSLVFPHCVKVHPADVYEYVDALMDIQERTDVPQGSSFAVTVDNLDGTWNLWLSEASWKYLGFVEPADIGEILSNNRQPSYDDIPDGV